jgi:hypothetical protein
MKTSRILPLLVAASMLGACEFVGNGLVPSVTGEAADGAPQPAQIVPLDESELGEPSGTSAGVRIAQLRSDLTQLQQTTIQQLQRAKQLRAGMETKADNYRTAVSTIKPASQDPAAMRASQAGWQIAQAQLQGMSADLDQMNGLSAEVEKSAASAADLLQSIREANGASDATDVDHQQLQLLEKSAGDTAASLDQLRESLRQEVPPRSEFLETQRTRLAQLAPSPAAVASAELSARQPFVVIPFKDPAVDYQQPLYDAVSTALERWPEVAFDLVAVAPAAESAEAARADMEKVRASLQGMGLPPERVSVSEITDPSVQSNEVRLYVR